MRRRDVRRRALPALLAAVALVGGLLVWRHQAVPVPAPARPAAATGPALPHRFSVLFTGDSFTTGVLGSTWASYSCILARGKGWDCDVDGEPGTGFVDDGRAFGDHKTHRLIDRLDQDKRLYAVDMVFVDAGRADLGSAPDVVVAAATEYLGRVAALWPNAVIVVQLPYWLRPGGYDNYDQLRAGFAAATAGVRGVLLDPVGEHWFDDQPLDRMVIPAGVYPNALGNQTIAADIAASLARHGLGNLGGAA